MLFSPQILARRPPAIVASGATTTFDPSNKSTNITLDATNLIATAGASAGLGTNVRSIANHSSGTYKAEFTLGGTANGGFGICNGSFPIGSVGTWAGSTNDAITMLNDGSWYVAAGGVASGIGALNVGDVMTLEVDLTNKLMYAAKNAGSLTGSQSFALLGSGPFYFIVEGDGSGVVWTANTGGSASTRSPTGGYVNW